MISFLYLLGNETKECPPDWEYNNEYCYTLVKRLESWSRANELCNGLGAHLMSVHSLQENQFASGMMYVK